MNKTILVAGATGNLGSKITYALLEKGATVHAIVRKESDADTIKLLEQKGVKIFNVDMTNQAEMAQACKGVDCVVSALSGLKDVIVGTQKILLDAAIQAGVPRFIPSDFSLDFTHLIEGNNRNLDFRKQFQYYLDSKPIKATTIFNGAFMELLTGDMPLILSKFKRILCWGNPNQTLDFTITYDIATYTAHVALDDSSPRYLHIAGSSINSTDMAMLVSHITGQKYKPFKAGSIGLFNILIKITKTMAGGEQELYPPWQGMQYMRDMMEGRVKIAQYDNDRYPNMQWTTVKDYLIDQKIA